MQVYLIACSPVKHQILVASIKKEDSSSHALPSALFTVLFSQNTFFSYQHYVAKAKKNKNQSKIQRMTENLDCVSTFHLLVQVNTCAHVS